MLELCVIRFVLLCKGVKTLMMQWCFIQRMQGLPWTACRRIGEIFYCIYAVPNENKGMHSALIS